MVDPRINQGGKLIHYSNVYIYIYFEFSSEMFSLTGDSYPCIVLPWIPTPSFCFLRVVSQILQPILVQIAVECLRKCVARLESHFHFVTNPSDAITLVSRVPVATRCCDSGIMVGLAAM